MKQLVIKREYDENNRLIFEQTKSMSYIYSYDKNGNQIYYKEFNHRTGEIITECFSEYDDSNNLIHRKDPPNYVEYFCKYDENNRLIETYNSSGSYLYKYDEKGNIIYMIDTESDEESIEYENIYLD